MNKNSKLTLTILIFLGVLILVLNGIARYKHRKVEQPPTSIPITALFLISPLQNTQTSSPLPSATPFITPSATPTYTQTEPPAATVTPTSTSSASETATNTYLPTWTPVTPTQKPTNKPTSNVDPIFPPPKTDP